MDWLRRFALILAVLVGADTASAQFMPTTGSTEVPETAAPSPNDVREFLRLLGDPTIQAWIADSANPDGTLDSGLSLTLREQMDAQLARIGERARSLVLAWRYRRTCGPMVTRASRMRLPGPQ